MKVKIKSLIGKYRIVLILILIIALAVAAYAVYRSQSNKLLKAYEYSHFKDSLTELSESSENGIESQDELRSFIEGWADEHSLDYKEDKAGNIIFDTSAAGRKKNATPTLVIVGMNYETAADNAALLASAASVALSDIEAGRRTVVFANDEKNLGNGYRSLSRKYIKDKTKVIYMDQGSSFYLSTGSFSETFSEAVVPAEREESTLDTAVKVKITGIASDEVGTGISKHPDPISAVSSLLTRLKSKSSICRLADIKVESNGNMYPTGVEATFTLNSYAVSSFTSYIDKRIKAWDKTYGSEFENIEFSYEVINDAGAMPETVYTADTTNALTSVLYTIKTGIYKYSDSDPLPDGKKAGELYGINCATDIETSDDEIKISFVTQAYDEMFTNRIIVDSTAAAELYGCTYKVNDTIDEFSNERGALARTFTQTYKRVNSKITPNSSLEMISDNYADYAIPDVNLLNAMETALALRGKQEE